MLVVSRHTTVDYLVSVWIWFFVQKCYHWRNIVKSISSTIWWKEINVKKEKEWGIVLLWPKLDKAQLHALTTKRAVQPYNPADAVPHCVTYHPGVAYSVRRIAVHLYCFIRVSRRRAATVGWPVRRCSRHVAASARSNSSHSGRTARPALTRVICFFEWTHALTQQLMIFVNSYVKENLYSPK